MGHIKMEKDFKVGDNAIITDQYPYRGCKDRIGIIVDIIPYGQGFVDIVRVRLKPRFSRKAKTLGFELWQIMVPIK